MFLQETVPNLKSARRSRLHISRQSLGYRLSEISAIFVQVHYTGKLKDGKVFDSGDISFDFGQGQVRYKLILKSVP